MKNLLRIGITITVILAEWFAYIGFFGWVNFVPDSYLNTLYDVALTVVLITLPVLAWRISGRWLAKKV